MSSKALAESGDWSTPANNFVKSVIPDPYYTVLKNGFCIAGSILFAGSGVLIGGAINTAFTLRFDLIPDGRIDSDWKDLLNDFGTACMIISITTTTRTGEKLFAYRYAYDYNGNRIVKQDVRELTSGDLHRVGDYGRIGEQPKLPQATRYRYDPLQRIVGVRYADGREESLAYDSRNRLTEVIRKDNKRAENNRITSYQYDNQGNTLQEETGGYTESLLQTSRYEYDGFNKTRKVTVEYFGNETDLPTATQTQENFYDAENLRYGIAENGARTNFITNGWKVVSEQDESNQTTKRIVLGYGIIASDSLKQGDGYQYFHWNEHGDTEYITGEDGQVLNSYGYDAFGSLTTAEEIVRNRYTYNGEQYDAITSQYYLRARFYNPQVARFTQEDVYRGDGLNLYAYCANNPVMYEDTRGIMRRVSVQS